ncbi:MAG: nuclear transport factor 2 family protein [Bryobacteraceae bacterium]|nr:nuclear transport factor 2 family protein [Bryobacteraceae bacterium]
MTGRIDAEFATGFIERLLHAVNTHDAQAVAELCAEDVVWEDPAAPETLRGREAVLLFHRDVMFRAIPDVRIELADGPHLAVDGRSLAMLLRIRGTMTGPLVPPGFAPTGGPVEFETAEFSRFSGGLLASHKVVLNMLDLARQIRAVPGPGSFGDKIGVWLQRVVARKAGHGQG